LQVKAFEQEAAAYLGVRHAVGLNSGTDALTLGLRALGVGQGDEVITSPFSFVAAAEAIRQAGATPVFADIEPNSFNLDPGAVAERITSRTKAVVPVHLYGRPAAIEPLLELAQCHGLPKTDCAWQHFLEFLVWFREARATQFFFAQGNATAGRVAEGGSHAVAFVGRRAESAPPMREGRRWRQGAYGSWGAAMLAGVGGG
jgi:hypothetical protein